MNAISWGLFHSQSGRYEECHRCPLFLRARPLDPPEGDSAISCPMMNLEHEIKPSKYQVNRQSMCLWPSVLVLERLAFTSRDLVRPFHANWIFKWRSTQRRLVNSKTWPFFFFYSPFLSFSSSPRSNIFAMIFNERRAGIRASDMHSTHVVWGESEAFAGLSAPLPRLRADLRQGVITRRGCMPWNTF